MCVYFKKKFWCKSCFHPDLVFTTSHFSVEPDREKGFHLDVEDYLSGVLILASELVRSLVICHFLFLIFPHHCQFFYMGTKIQMSDSFLSHPLVTGQSLTGHCVCECFAGTAVQTVRWLCPLGLCDLKRREHFFLSEQWHSSFIQLFWGTVNCRTFTSSYCLSPLNFSLRNCPIKINQKQKKAVIKEFTVTLFMSVRSRAVTETPPKLECFLEF